MWRGACSLGGKQREGTTCKSCRSILASCGWVAAGRDIFFFSSSFLALHVR